MDAFPDSTTTRNAIDVLDTQRELVRHASVELSPRQLDSTGPLTDYLSRGTRVYVPSIPGAAWRETMAACQRLSAEGMLPVPHLPARLMKSAAQLDERLGELAEAGVSEVREQRRMGEDAPDHPVPGDDPALQRAAPRGLRVGTAARRGAGPPGRCGRTSTLARKSLVDAASS